jgi:hypothetical protein
MLIVAYNINGVILHHVVPSDHTVNAEYYRAFLEHHLHLAVRQKRLHFIIGVLPLVLHDSPRCHVAKPVQDLLAWLQWKLWNILPTPRT